MNQKSKFFAALAAASSLLAPVAPTLAADLPLRGPQLELAHYKNCLTGDQVTCCTFLQRYPNSQFAPEVMSRAIDDCAKSELSQISDDELTTASIY